MPRGGERQTDMRPKFVYPEAVTEFRPDDEKVCPICGKPYFVIQIDSDLNLVRVGCWNHWRSDKILRVEPVRSIAGVPAKDFSAYKNPCAQINNINGYDWP